VTFAYLPACIIETGCPLCVSVYGYLALRCGRDNRRQRGWERLSKALGVDWRTAKAHAEHLAERGWVKIHATTTETGAHRAVEIWLAHCPPLKIKGEAPFPLDRNHCKTRPRSRRTVVQPLQETDAEFPTTVVGEIREPPTTAAPPSSDRGAADAGLSRYLEVVDTSEVLDTYDGPELSEDEAVVLVLAHFPGATVVESEAC
jgi:hypothetical protein